MMEVWQLARQILRLISLSEGGHFAQLAKALDRLSRLTGCRSGRQLADLLQRELQRAIDEQDRVVDENRVRLLLDVVLDKVFETVRERHALASTEPPGFEQLLASPYSVARALSIALRLSRHRMSAEQLSEAVSRELCCFLGYRPVPVLSRPDEELQPAHKERRLVVPLWVADVGVAYTKYELLIRDLIELLRRTPESLLLAGGIDLERLREISVETDIYDFLQPTYHRPGHSMGEYDPEDLDQDGFHRRFVFRQWLLDELVAWMMAAEGLAGVPSLSRQDQILQYRRFSAAVALGGAMIVGAGICGTRPAGQSSDNVLAEVVREVAEVRDSFYQYHLQKCPEALAEWANSELDRYRQPFALARQHLNRSMMRRVANQRLTGQAVESATHAGLLSAAKTLLDNQTSRYGRHRGVIACLLAEARAALKADRLEDAVRLLGRATELLRDGVPNREVPDPRWFIAFSGQFPLGPAPQDSVPDFRLSQLQDEHHEITATLIEAALCAAMQGKSKLARHLIQTSRELHEWWVAAGGTFGDDLENEGEGGKDPEQENAIKNLSQFAWKVSLDADANTWLRAALELGSTTRSVAISVLIDRGYLRSAAEALLRWLPEQDLSEPTLPRLMTSELAMRWLRDAMTRWRNLRQRTEHQQTLDRIVWHRLVAFVNALNRFADRYRAMPSGHTLRQWLEEYERPWEASLPCWPPHGWSLESVAPAHELALWEKLDQEVFGPPLDIFPSGQPVVTRSSRPIPSLDEFERVSPDEEDEELEDVAEVDPSEEEEDDELDQLHDQEEDQHDENLIELVIELPEPEDLADTNQWQPPSHFWADDDGTEEGEVPPPRWEFTADPGKVDRIAVEASELLKHVGAHMIHLQTLAQAWYIITVHGPKLRDATDQQEKQYAVWCQYAMYYYRELVRMLRRGSFMMLPVKPELHTQFEAHDVIVTSLRQMLTTVSQSAVEMLRTAETVCAYLPPRATPDLEEMAPDWVRSAVRLRRVLLGRASGDVGRITELLIRRLATESLKIPVWRSRANPQTVIFPAWLLASLCDLVTWLACAGHPDLALKLASDVAKGQRATVWRDSEKHSSKNDTSHSHEVMLAAYEALAYGVAPVLEQALDDGKSEQALLSILFWDRLQTTLNVLYTNLCNHVEMSYSALLLHPGTWTAIVDFIKEYGADVFTQDFMQRENLLALLRLGVWAYIARFKLQPPKDVDRPALLKHLIKCGFAEKQEISAVLRAIAGAVLSNYNAYQEYNSTTAYSDYGNFLYVFLEFARLMARAEQLVWFTRPDQALYKGIARYRIELANKLCSEAEPVNQAVRDLSVRLEHLERKYGMVLGSVRDFIRNYLPHQREYTFLREAAVLANMPDGQQRVPEQLWLETLQAALDRSVATGTPNAVGLDAVDHVASGWCVCPGLLWAFQMRTTAPEQNWRATFEDLERLFKRTEEYVAVSFHELRTAEFSNA